MCVGEAFFNALDRPTFVGLGVIGSTVGFWKANPAVSFHFASRVEWGIVLVLLSEAYLDAVQVDGVFDSDKRPAAPIYDLAI